MKLKPLLPYVLGILILLPFVALAGNILYANLFCNPYEGRGHFDTPLRLSRYLVPYATLILTFLGGMRWGEEIQRNPDRPNVISMCLSVLLPLAGWAAVVPISWYRIDYALFILAAAYGIHALWDGVMVSRHRHSARYFRLRTAIACIAIISLLIPAHIHLIINNYVYCVSRA